MDTFTITVYCTSCHHLDTLLTGQSSFGPIGVRTLLEIQMKLGVGGSRRLTGTKMPLRGHQKVGN